MGHRTPLYDRHVAAGAKIVDFGGWDMPLHYGSQKQEHLNVRASAGVFDVSHMTVVDVAGDGAKAWLQTLLANDVDRLSPGQALYSCMLNDQGGIIDDLICYRLPNDRYRLVVNASTRDKDLAWFRSRLPEQGVDLTERADLAMLAVQGPGAREIAAACLPDSAREPVLALAPFHAFDSDRFFVARTGYTGEDGFEILADEDAIRVLWDTLLEAGVQPAGLGARDTLRLEAAMHLYGNDMDESVTPLDCGLGWTVALEPPGRSFIGREAVEARRDAERPRFVGLVLEGKGVLRSGQRVVIDGLGEGTITSGGFSPTMNRSIALARLPAGDYAAASADIRGRLQPVRVVRPPFVRHGEIRI